MKWLEKIFISLLLFCMIGYGFAFFSIQNRWSLQVATTTSMQPQIQAYDLCLIDQKYSKKNIKKGDLIVFEEEKEMVIRKVVSTNPLETMGTKNETKDGIPITRKNYRGKVIRVIPKVGKKIVIAQKYKQNIKKILVKLSSTVVSLSNS